MKQSSVWVVEESIEGVSDYKAITMHDDRERAAAEVERENAREHGGLLQLGFRYREREYRRVEPRKRKVKP